MTMTLERYSGIGYDYLVLDTNNNENKNDSKKEEKESQEEIRKG